MPKLTTPITLSPPSKLTPFPTPRSIYIDLENKTVPKAKKDLQASFAAKSEAAYCGYDIGTYTLEVSVISLIL